MNIDIPAWATRRAEAQDYVIAQDSQRRGALHITWPNLTELRTWAKLHGWPAPWFGFEAAFLGRLFESETNFRQAVGESGIELCVLQEAYTLSGDRVRALDALYDSRTPSGQPDGWAMLVEELREIRRAVEAGVVIQVEAGPALRSWQEFYAWAHGRYHMLEDGADKWIGDDQ